MIRLTIVGPDSIYPAKEHIKVGDVLYLQKDESSKYPFTINVYNSEDEQVGNVSNSEHTTKAGCKKSSEVWDLISLREDLEVLDVQTVTFKDGKSSIALIVGLNKIKENKGGITMENLTKRIRVTVGGSKESIYGGVLPEYEGKNMSARYSPAKDAKAGIEVPVTLDIGKDYVYVIHDGELCGEVSRVVEDEETFGTLETLLSMVEKFGNKDIEATIIGLAENIKYDLRVEFKGETALEKAINKLVSAGGLSKKDIDKKMKWLNKLDLSEKNIIHIFENQGTDINDRIPQGDFVFINRESITETVIASYNAGLNILLEGPKASGKNTLIEDIGRLYNRPVYELQINAQTDNETILGSKTLVAKTGTENEEALTEAINQLKDLAKETKGAKDLLSALISGDDDNIAIAIAALDAVSKVLFKPLIESRGETEVEFEPSVLIKAMEEGGIIVFDEVNTGHPSVMALLNSVLDNRKRIQVPSYGLVKAHPNFRAFATMNKDYQGTFEMNEATASRFVPVVFEEPTGIKDILKKNVPTAEKETLDICDKIYKDIRKQTRNGSMQSQSINIRAFIYTCIQVDWGISLKTALINNVANSCPDLDDREAIKKLVDLVVA